MVAGMSSSHCRRNPHRTRRTILEVPSELKPVSGDKASILHSKGTTVSQELNSAESHRPRTTKEEKQNALPDLSACLQKSRHQLNGPVFLKLHELELMTTPKCRSETSNMSRKGRKKKVIQPSEKEAGRKACSDGLDHSEHNSCPEQHLRSQKTKGTRYRHSKKTQNSQTPSDVSTALHTCTTATLLDKEISSCHTNGDCRFIPCTPKRGRPRTRPLFSSTPTSDFQPLSPKRAKNSLTQHRHQNANESSGVKTPPTDVTPSRPQKLVVTGRPRGRKKKNMEEQLIVSPSVKQSRKSVKSDLESPQEEPAVEPPPPNEAHVTNQMPEPQESVTEHNSCPEQHLRSQKTKGTRYRHSKKTQNSQTPSDVSTALHTCTTATLLDKEISSCHTNGDCRFIPRTPKRGRPRTRPLFSSTPTSDFQPLSPKRAKNSLTQHRHQNANESSGVKTPPTDVTPSRPQRLVATGRPRGRKKKNMEEQLIVSPSVKQSRKSVKSDLESPQEEPAVEPPPPNEAHVTNQMPEPQESVTEHNSCPEQHLRSQKTKGTRYQHSKKTQNSQTPSDVSTALHTCTTATLLDKEISSCHTNGDCRFIPRTPKRGRPRTRPLFSSTPTSDFQPLSPKRAKNSLTQHRHQNANESSGVKTPPTDVTPSRPQRLVVTGRPRGRKKKNMEEQLIVSPSVKQSRKSVKSDLESPQEEPAVEPPPPNEAHVTNQMPEPQESDQNMSSDLCIELSLQEKPHSLNPSLPVEEDDLDDDDEELPSFLQQDNKKPLSISEGLCVWCKLRKNPYWPAVVKSVNRKNKKASIVFIDCFLIDQKRIRKGFSVSLRKLKPFDCEECASLVDIAKEKYGNAITWSLELISDYRIRIGCRSFSGSFIEYCSADISCPVRRRYSEGKSVLTFPSQEILGEQCDSSDNNMEDIVMEEQDEFLSKKVLPDRSKAARNHANKQLVDFIIRRKVENRLLAVISGRESSKWMQALQKPSRPVVNIYLEDDEQVENVYRYLSTVCDSAPQIKTCLENIQAERISLILDVLLPEAIIYAIAGVHKLSLEKAEEKYRRGPCFSNRERQEFDKMIEQQVKLKEITQHHVQ